MGSIEFGDSFSLFFNNIQIMTSAQRFEKFLKHEPIDRLPVTPILMMFAAKFIDKTYRDYYLDYRVLVESWLRCHERFQFDMLMVISDPYRETEESVFEAAIDCLKQGRGRLILSPGCEVSLNTPVENVAAFCSRIAFEKYLSILRP